MALGSRRSDRSTLRPSPARAAWPLYLAGALAVLTGQPARSQASITAVVAQPIPDPWEKDNRKALNFSMKVDRAVVAPVVRGYFRLTPAPVRAALGRAIHNLDEPRVAGNDLLQGHLVRGGSAMGRFLLNALLGAGGLFDPATDAGLAHHDSDFGQTLGRYGARTGPYIMLPLVGPSDVRDGIGLIVDALSDPLAWTTGGLATTFSLVRGGVAVTQARVDNNDQMTALRSEFTDPYATLRSAYAQNRASQIRQARGEAAATAVQALPDFGPQSRDPPEPSPADPSPTKAPPS